MTERFNLTPHSPLPTPQRVALIGSNGMLASAVKRVLPTGTHLLEYDLPEFDLTSREQVLSLAEEAPGVIINCAAYTNVDGCEQNRDIATRVNGDGPGHLAELAKKTDAILVHVSTDFVFSGDKSEPYRESDTVEPLSVYGESKLLGEQKVIQSGLEKYFIVRTSWLYGADGNNFVETMIRLAKEREELKIVADQRGTPTWSDDLARAIFSLLKSAQSQLPTTDSQLPLSVASLPTPHSPYGIYHYSNAGECSWYEFTQEIVAQIGKKENLKVQAVEPILTEGYPLPAERPKYSVMSKDKISRITGIEIPDWQESLGKYLRSRK